MTLQNTFQSAANWKIIKRIKNKDFNMKNLCFELHHLFKQLPRYHYPYDLDQVPRNGIYILFERGEKAHGGDRIVRIGSHRGDGRLVSRLDEHFINENKDRSIFRKNIGRALLAKNKDEFLDKWDMDRTSRKAKESYWIYADNEKQAIIESEVTAIIRKNFSFSLVQIKTGGTRKLFEARLIATIAKCNDYPPSDNWLGSYSPIKKIRDSGLWNVQHVGGVTLTQEEFMFIKELLLK